MPETSRHGESTSDVPSRNPRPDGQWLAGAVGVALAVGVILFRPALPYELDSAVSIGLFVGGIGAAVWLAYKIRQWRQHPQHQLPGGLWAAVGTTAIITALLVIVAIPQEENGYRSVNCQFGVYGFGAGKVWAKIEPEQQNILKPHTVTVRWGSWIGQPEPVALTQTTYFTFLKRDFRSGPADVSVTPDAKITCGDGEPPLDDRPRIHLDGDDWKQGKSTAQNSPVPPINCTPADAPNVTHAEVIFVNNDASLAIGPIYYTAELAGATVQFEAGGELRGEIPAGKQLLLFEWGDPVTTDSTLEHNPGAGNYFYDTTFNATMDGHCWHRPEGRISYSGANGLTFQLHLILVDDSQVAAFTLTPPPNGYSSAELVPLGVTFLAYFEVPTKDL